MSKLSKAQINAQKKYDEGNKERRNYLRSRSSARSFIRTKATKEDLQELKEMIKNKEEEIMNYENELKRLEKENGTNGNLNVSAYSNKEELLQRLSENADDPKETYEYMKEELDYLADDKKIYQVDTGNGFPTYYDDAKEAYESI